MGDIDAAYILLFKKKSRTVYMGDRVFIHNPIKLEG